MLVTRYVDDLVGVGVHLVQWPGIFCGREFFGGELELHSKTRTARTLVCSTNYNLYMHIEVLSCYYEGHACHFYEMVVSSLPQIIRILRV